MPGIMLLVSSMIPGIYQSRMPYSRRSWMRSVPMRTLSAGSTAARSLRRKQYITMRCTQATGSSQGYFLRYGNAARYAKKTVTVTIRGESNRIRCLVADDGDGVDESDLPYIFDRFFKGRDGQFGLSLAIARRAAELMGGGLTAVNRPEGGAEFSLTLKKAKEE